MNKAIIVCSKGVFEANEYPPALLNPGGIAKYEVVKPVQELEKYAVGRYVLLDRTKIL